MLPGQYFSLMCIFAFRCIAQNMYIRHKKGITTYNINYLIKIQPSGPLPSDCPKDGNQWLARRVYKA